MRCVVFRTEKGDPASEWRTGLPPPLLGMASKKRPPQRPGVPGRDNGDPGGFEEDEDGIALFQDFSSLTLRKHHETKPIWVCPNLRIYLEAFNPMYQFAYDFLIAICEPVAR